MSIKKTLAVVGSGLLAAPALFAEGETLTVDTTKAGQAVDAVGTAVSSLISGKVTTNILLIIGAGLVIAMIFLGIRWMLRGGKTAAK